MALTKQRCGPPSKSNALLCTDAGVLEDKLRACAIRLFNISRLAHSSKLTCGALRKCTIALVDTRALSIVEIWKRVVLMRERVPSLPIVLFVEDTYDNRLVGNIVRCPSVPEIGASVHLGADPDSSSIARAITRAEGLALWPELAKSVDLLRYPVLSKLWRAAIELVAHPLSVSELAAYCGYEDRTLQRLLQAIEHPTPKQMIRYSKFVLLQRLRARYGSAVARALLEKSGIIERHIVNPLDDVTHTPIELLNRLLQQNPQLSKYS